MREITYSTRPMTLGEMVLCQRIQSGNDPAALVALLASRTDLAEDELLALDMDDLDGIMTKVADAMNMASTLQSLAKGL